MNGDQLIITNDGSKDRYHFLENNYVYCKWNNNNSDTRIQIDKEFRHKGLVITYVDNNGIINNEQYISDSIDDNAWGSDSNWHNWGDSIKDINFVLNAEAVAVGVPFSSNIERISKDTWRINMRIPILQ